MDEPNGTLKTRAVLHTSVFGSTRVFMFVEVGGGEEVVVVEVKTSMDEPLPLPYLAEKASIRHEKHTESVKREGQEIRSGSGSGSGGGSAVGSARRKIEVGEPLPLGYEGKSIRRVDKGTSKGKSSKTRERVKVDLGEPLPLDTGVVSEESFQDKEKSVEERGNLVKQQKMKVMYDFGTPLPLDYGVSGRRANVTSQISDESYTEEAAQLASSAGVSTSSPLEGTTLAELLNEAEKEERGVDTMATTEEILNLAKRNDGDPVRDIKTLIEDEKHGAEYRLAVVRAQRIAKRQVRVFEEVLKGGGVRWTNVKDSKFIAVAGICMMLILALATLSYVLAD